MRGSTICVSELQLNPKETIWYYKMQHHNEIFQMTENPEHILAYIF